MPKQPDIVLAIISTNRNFAQKLKESLEQIGKYIIGLVPNEAGISDLKPAVVVLDCTEAHSTPIILGSKLIPPDAFAICIHMENLTPPSFNGKLISVPLDYKDNKDRYITNLARQINILIAGYLINQTALKLSQPKPEIIPPQAKKWEHKAEIVLIAVSTGGPVALRTFFKLLPGKLNVPMLVVQHMPNQFTSTFANRLSEISNLPISEAQRGEPIVPGKILIAPGGYHMIVSKYQNTRVVELSDAPYVNGVRPSADVLFESVYEHYTKTLSIILTGMGSDGTEGVRLLRRKINYCIAQDEKTSTIYGMPRVVAESNLVDEILPLEQIPQRVFELT